MSLEDCLGELSRGLTLDGAADRASPMALEAEFEHLHEEYASSLVRYAISYCGDPDLARDAVQDCFLRYFEMRRGGARVEQPKAWLVRVLRNQLIDRSRRERLEQEVSAITARELRALPAWPQNSLGGDAGVARLWKRIEALVSPKELACLQMRVAGFSYAEIAEALGVQSGTVSVFLTRSREKAAAVLEPRAAPAGDKVSAHARGRMEASQAKNISTSPGSAKW